MLHNERGIKEKDPFPATLCFWFWMLLSCEGGKLPKAAAAIMELDRDGG